MLVPFIQQEVKSCVFYDYPGLKTKQNQTKPKQDKTKCKIINYFVFAP